MGANSPDGYYTEGLAAERLRRCYEVAPPRVQDYLQAETDFVLRHMRPRDSVLELGCGYGRVLEAMMGLAHPIVGIDTSRKSLELAREVTGGPPRCYLAAMDAARLAFRDRSFDVVVCIQNGLSAFKVDRGALFKEAVRVTRPAGRVFFSSYAKSFWPDRLEWFRIQAAQGLVGEIDEDATGDGVIVCRDGFRAETVDPEEFIRLAASVGAYPKIAEVGGSSLFCVIHVH